MWILQFAGVTLSTQGAQGGHRPWPPRGLGGDLSWTHVATVLQPQEGQPVLRQPWQQPLSLYIDAADGAEDKEDNHQRRKLCKSSFPRVLTRRTCS